MPSVKVEAAFSAAYTRLVPPTPDEDVLAAETHEGAVEDEDAPE